MKNWMLWLILGAVLMFFGLTGLMTIVSIVAWGIIKFVVAVVIIFLIYWYFNNTK